jgi:hypothetical protein
VPGYPPFSEDGGQCCRLLSQSFGERVAKCSGRSDSSDLLISQDSPITAPIGTTALGLAGLAEPYKNLYTSRRDRCRTKSIIWLGNSRRDLRAFPALARRLAGFQLRRLQQGLDPDDWKPMQTVGPGVREIRIHRRCTPGVLLGRDRRRSMSCVRLRRKRRRRAHAICESAATGSVR